MKIRSRPIQHIHYQSPLYVHGFTRNLNNSNVQSKNMSWTCYNIFDSRLLNYGTQYKAFLGFCGH